MLNYIITESGISDSFDPLDADKTQNINVMRMLFSTPLEIDNNNVLSSNVLSEFGYDPKKREIKFILAENAKFSNGQQLKIEDLVFSILRFAFFRPKFPVIENIVGLNDWVINDNLNSRPTGVVVEGNAVFIRLGKTEPNPLFRFCLEIFSILPRNCFDATGKKLECKNIPSSGRYIISEKNTSMILFAKNTESSFFNTKYEKIKFNYFSLIDAIKKDIDKNTIITANEIDYLNNNSKLFESLNMYWLAYSRFAVVRFNTKSKAFDKPKARRLFSELLRAELSIAQSKLQISSSIFPKLVSGYLDESKFEKGDKLDLSELTKYEINLPIVKNSSLSMIYNSIVGLSKKYKFKINLIEYNNLELLVSDFSNNKVDIIVGASGFWAHDPFGDFKMWATPGLHKTMTYLWSDTELYDLLAVASDSSISPANLTALMQKINLRIYNSSIVSPVAHFRRIILSKSNVKGVHQSLTTSYPWEIELNVND